MYCEIVKCNDCYAIVLNPLSLKLSQPQPSLNNPYYLNFPIQVLFDTVNLLSFGDSS